MTNEKTYRYYSARWGDMRGLLESYFFDNAKRDLCEKILHKSGRVPMADVYKIMNFIDEKGRDYFFKCPALEILSAKKENFLFWVELNLNGKKSPLRDQEGGLMYFTSEKRAQKYLNENEFRLCGSKGKVIKI
jgi:hypothetical protein